MKRKFQANGLIEEIKWLSHMCTRRVLPRSLVEKPEDYLPIHELMDSSKAAMPDNRHRAMTHNSWFITTILDKIFGSAIKNSDGKMIPTRDIGEQHVAEDFGEKFIPSAQDHLQFMEAKGWMSNTGEYPPSAELIRAASQDRNTVISRLPQIRGFPIEGRETDLRKQVQEMMDQQRDLDIDRGVRGPMYD